MYSFTVVIVRQGHLSNLGEATDFNAFARWNIRGFDYPHVAVVSCVLQKRAQAPKRAPVLGRSP